jgi:hypothetical protein
MPIVFLAATSTPKGYPRDRQVKQAVASLLRG